MEPKGGPKAPQSLTTHLKAPNGASVATAKFEFDDAFVTITVQTTGLGQLTPGFHGVHVHSVGKCEANSVAPSGGAPGDFLSAGGHYRAPGNAGDHQSGNLTSLQVRKDGAALLVTTTDAFTKDDLLSGQGTAIIIHAGPDNFANIPPDRYTQVNGTPGPDETTISTGDAGKRVACGVIGAG
jgi:superoxide dismutase, Cu-Zn family